MIFSSDMRACFSLLRAVAEGERGPSGLVQSLRPRRHPTGAYSGSSVPGCAVRPRWPRVMRTRAQEKRKEDGRKIPEEGRRLPEEGAG